MSGIDPLQQPDDHIQAPMDALSASLPAAAPGQPQPFPSFQGAVPPALRPFPLHPNFWWAILWCVGMVLLTQIPGGVVAVILLVGATIVFPDRINMDDMANMGQLLRNPIGLISFGAGIFVAHGLIIIFALVLLRVLAGRDWYRQVALRLPAAQHVGLVLVVMPAFIVLANGVYYVIVKILHVPSIFSSMGSGMEQLEGAFTGWTIPPAVFLIGVMPALSEELWCRAFLGRGLVGRHGPILGVLGTSFLFGFIHIDPAQGLMAMFMGVMLHYAYLMSRSLLVPMLMHFLNNSLAVILPNVPALAKLDKAEPSDVLSLFTGAVVLLFAVCWALYQSRARLVSKGEPAWRPPYPGVVCPPPDSGTAIETPLPSALSMSLVAAGLTAFVVGFVMALQHVARL